MAENIHTLKSWEGKIVVDPEGNAFRLSSIEISDSIRATAQTEEGLQARLWWLPEKYRRLEWDKNYQQVLAQKNLSTCRIIVPESQLVLKDPVRGYLVLIPKNRSLLSRFAIWNGKGSFQKWYAQANLRTRLMLGARLAQAVHQWSYVGIARSEWDLDKIIVNTVKGQYSIGFTDVENFCIPSRAIYSISSPDVLAPEIIQQQYQPGPQSDAFSLAVVLFLLLRGLHPYGSPGAQIEKIYAGTGKWETGEDRPLFHPVFSGRLKMLFDRCLGEGRMHRLKRPLASEWYESCLLAADQTIECISCCLAFYAPPMIRPNVPLHCPGCREPIDSPVVLNFFDSVQTEDGTPLLGELWDCSLAVDSQGRVILGRHTFSYATSSQGTKRMAKVKLAKGGVILENISDDSFILHTPTASRPSKINPGKVRQVPIGSWIFFAAPQSEHAVRGCRIQHSGEKLG